MNRKNIELLAPAGSYHALVAAINAGADAVYCGLNRFGARAYADNFKEEELLRGLEYAHLYGAKVYLTVNTCLKDRELHSLPEFLAPFVSAGLDAVLVQDFGVLQTLRECFPALPLHASTQMGVTSGSGAAFLQRKGVSRVVLARELSLPEIAAIHNAVDLELECFIHGALCMCYSGQCLLSSLLGGRSGNRGRCAGTCRLPFTVGGEKSPSYPLSLKDLCTISFLPKLIDAGVTSFKIEGRMKSAAVTAGVTSIYRKYLNLAIENPTNTRVEKRDLEALLNLGNRSGFTDGFYFFHNDPSTMTPDSPAHTKQPDEVLIKKYGKFLEEKKLPLTGHAVFHVGEAARLTVICKDATVTVTGDVVQRAEKRPLSAEELTTRLRKTGETDFTFEALKVEADDEIFMPVQSINSLRREALKKLTEAMVGASCPMDSAIASPVVTSEKISDDVRASREVYSKERESARITNSVTQELSISAHVTTADQLAAALKAENVDTVILDSFLYERESFFARFDADLRAAHAAGKRAVFALPYIFRKETADFYERSWDAGFCEDTARNGKSQAERPDAILVRSYDALGFLLERDYPAEKLILDERLYTYNNKARSAFQKLGIRSMTLPVELNEKELKHRDNAGDELIIYGRLPLMLTASCIHKNCRGCDHGKATETLTDRYQKVFPVRADCTDCYNLLYNADVLDLTGDLEAVKRLGVRSIRYSFTTETGEEITRILRGERFPHTDYTRGHFRRGVE